MVRKIQTKNISSPTKGVEEKPEWFQPISSFEDLSRWITISFQKNVICDTFLEWRCDFGLGRGFRVRS